MRKNTNFKESFKYAFGGFCYALTHERNLRFHVCAAVMVFIFAYFFGLSNTEWIVLFMTVAFVITCELINTAVENAVDTATREYSKTAKTAKDVAAAAVMVSSAAAICVGVILFGDIPKFINTVHIVFGSFLRAFFVTVAGILGVLFIVFGEKK